MLRLSPVEPFVIRAPEPAPPAWFDIRADIAARVLSGAGIEIGGLHYPLAVPPGVQVTHVDRMTVPELRQHYPELNQLDLVKVDVVDDGERLDRFADSSLDFIIANGFLEHCHDPITTIANHLRKLVPGGILFYALPDRRFTFDVNRQVTPLEHIVRDYEEGPEWSRRQHFEEWARYVYEDPHEPPRSEEQVQLLADMLQQQDYSIHTHVFTQREILELFLHCRERFEQAFDIEVVWRRSIELIVVLRKAGPIKPPATVQPAAEVPAVRQAGAAARVREAIRSLQRTPLVGQLRAQILARRHNGKAVAREQVPLSVLRPELASWPAGATWRPQAVMEGRELAVLELAPGAPAVYPVRLPAGARFRALVSGANGTKLTVRLRGAGGVAERSVRADEREVMLGPLPAGSWRLELEVERGHGRWSEPGLEIPEDSIPSLAAAAISRDVEDVPAPEAADEGPLFSVLMPVHDPEPRFLEEAIASVCRQSFDGWELCLCDDGSSDEQVRAILARFATGDARIKLARHESARGISAATNAALGLASGHYIALLDHDDLLAADALEAAAELLSAQPELDMVYTDEDRVSSDGEVRSNVFLKPDWSPDFFRTAMYTCHLGVYRRSLVQAVGGFRSELDGAQDYDLVLRLTERTDRIGHVPRILYTWRIHGRSAASGAAAKPEVVQTACIALQEHLERAGIDGAVEPGPQFGWYRIRYQNRSPLSLLLPVANAPLAAPEISGWLACLRSWEPLVHAGGEVLLAGAPHVLSAWAELLSRGGVDGALVRFVPVAEAPSLAALVNAAAGGAQTELLLPALLPFQMCAADGLEQLAGLAGQPAVGAAGGTICDPHRRAEVGAIVFGDGWPMQALHGQPGVPFTAQVANFRALAGPIVIRTELFHSAGGLEQGLGGLAVVDLCLRLGQLGLRNALCSEAVFVRPAGIAPAEEDPSALVALRRRWRALGEDPYYNPGFWHGSGQFMPLD